MSDVIFPAGEQSQLHWSPEAVDRLSGIPEGFMRRLTAWRVEAYALREGAGEVTGDVFDAKLSSWQGAATSVRRSLPWDDDALERVARIPDTVKGMVMLEIERRAKAANLDCVTAEVLESSMSGWAATGDFHTGASAAPQSEERLHRDGFKHLYVGVDNSPPSNKAADLAVRLAQGLQARVTGSHVYAAALHESRFQQMETGLPAKYQDEGKLKKQRRAHDALIRRGLELISDSYVGLLGEACEAKDLAFEPRSLEGKNYAVLLEDIAEIGPDMVVLGGAGFGITDGGLGTVSERVLRRVGTDLLLVKEAGVQPGPITVGIDGSGASFAALRAALRLGERLGVPVDAVAAYDPEYHVLAFRALKGVLSDKAGRMFQADEQEQMHESVIDRGLAEVYEAHLTRARSMAKEEAGVDLPTSLLTGKPFAAIMEHLADRGGWMVVVGRSGFHHIGDGELGGTTENLARRAPQHVLVVAPEADEGLVPRVESLDEEGAELELSVEAAERLERVPEGFMRDAVMRRVAGIADTKGAEVVTKALVEEAIEQGRSMMAGMGRNKEKAGENGTS